MIIVSAFLYLVPLLGIICLSYLQGEDYVRGAAEGHHKTTSSSLLLNWIFRTLFSDKSGVPLIYAFLLHVELILLLCGLWFVS